MSSGPVRIARPASAAAEQHAAAAETERFFTRQRRDEATGFAMSLVMHLVAMLALTITFVVEVRPGSPRPVVVTASEVETRSPLEEVPVEIIVDEPGGANASALGPTALASSIVEHSVTRPAWQALDSNSGSDGQGTSSGPPQPSGTQFDLPKNAVQAGSFAAWWIPKVERYGEKVEPGQLPRVGQDYRIFVQIRVPEDRKVLKVSDLSGEIVGTDGYRQLIPDRAWVMDDDGKLVRAAGARSYLHAHDGAVEIVFKVQGAGKAGIRDTISIRSRILDEEQTLTLEFQDSEASSD